MTDLQETDDLGAHFGGRRRYSRREMLRFGVTGAGIIGVSPLLAACASSATPLVTTTTGAAPKRGGTLNFGRQTGPTQLDPANSIVEGDVYTLDKIFEPLYITSPKGALVPWLAQGHTVSTDGKTWTFSLREGVKFSDGKPVTAADVVFSDPPGGDGKGGSAQFLGLRHQVAQGDRRRGLSPSSSPSPGLRSCPISRCSPTRSCRPTSGARASRPSSRAPSERGRSRSSRSQRAATPRSCATRTTGSRASPISTRSSSATSQTTTSASSS